MQTMKRNWKSAAVMALVTQLGLWSVAAQNQDLDVKALLRRIEELEQKVKILEGKRQPGAEEQKAQSPPIEELDQKVKILERQRELDREAAEATSKENNSLFKVPDWVTGVRLVNDLRMRYDGIYAPDSGFVTRQRIRPRLRLGGIATLKEDFEIGFRLASSPSVVSFAALPESGGRGGICSPVSELPGSRLIFGM